MMFSRFLLQAISLNQLLADWLHVSPYFFSFDPKTNLFHVGPLRGGRLWTPYNLLNAFVLVLVTPAFFLYVLRLAISNEVGVDPKNAVSVAYIYTVGLLAIALVNGTNIVFSFMVEDVVSHANLLLAFQRSFKEAPIGTRICPPSSLRIGGLLKELVTEIVCILISRKGDLIGVFAQLLVLSFVIAPAPVTVAMNLLHFRDVLPMIVPSLDTYQGPSVYLLKLVLGVCIAILAIEMSRTGRSCALHLIFIAAWTSTLVRLIHHLGKQTSRQSAAMAKYQQLYQIHTRIFRTIELLGHLLYQAGLAAGVLSFAAVVIRWKFLNPSTYGMVVFIASVMGSFIAIMLPVVVHIVQFSDDMIRDWHQNIVLFEQGTQRYKKMVLRTLRPIGFPIAGKGLVDKKVGNDIIARIIFNTQDVIMFSQSLAT